jgi:hypothetical protein
MPDASVHWLLFHESAV